MKQTIGTTVVLSALAAVVIGAGRPGIETAAAQARPSVARPGNEVPKFQVDPAWPKIPNNWQLGQVASVSIDAADHVWVLQRPGTLNPEEKSRAAPPLLEFDAAGNFIQAWGGPGQGYEWPGSEHGVYVDAAGYVWIGGNGANDHQVLKFTKAGTFVMQIGRAGQSKGNADTQNLNQPADTFVYAKTNELFVADGYGNRRVIVFDAGTGRFKRMWGAFGNVPTDAPPNPALPDADEKGAPQFVQPVHAARVSSSAGNARRRNAGTARPPPARRSRQTRSSGSCMSATEVRPGSWCSTAGRSNCSTRSENGARLRGISAPSTTWPPIRKGTSTSRKSRRSARKTDASRNSL
jgi:hypothetical protein